MLRNQRIQRRNHSKGLTTSLDSLRESKIRNTRENGDGHVYGGVKKRKEKKKEKKQKEGKENQKPLELHKSKQGKQQLKWKD